MKRIYLLAVMAMLLPNLVLAQFTISGKITDQLTNQPLAGASVVVGNSSTQTDNLGGYRFSNLKSAEYKIKVSHLGYATVSKQIQLSSNQTINFALVSASILTDEITVSATRASANSPTTYRNITKEELQKKNLGQDLPYLLNQTPSVVVTSDAGAGIGYTGIRIRGSDPTRVNVTINGIPYNDTESQGTYWVNLPDFASSVDNIQIQRGVGTSTNGAGAFGGSLNIQTTTRRDTAYAELNNSVGSFASRKHTLNLGSGLIADKFMFDARLSNIASNGFVDRGASKLKSYFLSGAFYGKKDMLRANVFGGGEKTYQVWNGVPEAKLKKDDNGLLNHYYNNQGYLYNTPQDSVNL
ncbi:MAG TPA: TonB-dependent receptor, partial [Pedobacter sp.]